jgi:HNH endonuclease
MRKELDRLVRRRAQFRFEYCQLPVAASKLPFEIDHIIPKKHGGKTTSTNLALSCYYDNSFKGPNLAGLDPRTDKITKLFHPRRHSWGRHFRWDGPQLIGRTAIGRTTIGVLSINLELRVAHRQLLIEAGLFQLED